MRHQNKCRTWGNKVYSVTSQLPCLFRVSNSRKPELRLHHRIGQRESDSQLVLVWYRVRDTSTNGAVTRIGTKRCDASYVRRSDRLLKPQQRCALHFVYRAASWHFVLFFVFCRRFVYCVICSFVAGFMLMVYEYCISVLRCCWPIMPVIRGKNSSLISSWRNRS